MFPQSNFGEPRPCSSKSAGAQQPQSGQFNPEIDFAQLIGSFLQGSSAASSAVKNLASTFLEKSQLGAQKSNEVLSVTTTETNFEIKLDVSNYPPENISIRVENNSVFIEARHEEKEDKDGFVSREFVRRFVLPEGVLLEKMFSEIKSDHVLVLSAPRIVPQENTNERSIPINISKS